MTSVFGIHVGNSTACLAMYKPDDSKDVVEVISNLAGDRVTPSFVTATGDEYVVGAACKSLMASRWNTTVTCCKLMMDKEDLEPSNDGVRQATVVPRDGQLYYELPLETGVEYKTPADIMSYVYSSMYEMAKSAAPKEEDISCVMMVPKHFSEDARLRLETAAEAVGWNVLQIINEPAAGVLGYNLLSDKTPPPPQTILVYRLGGRSCEASVMDLNYGMVFNLDTEYSAEVGGKLLIDSLTNYLADEFYRKYKLNPRESHRSLTKLTLAAESCLHVLSTIESANCFVESLCEGVDFSYAMSRARFESLLSPFLPTFAKPILTVLARLAINADDVSTVLLCGGLLKIPRLKRYISEIFQESSAKIVPLPSGINYDEVMACGAARQAGCIAMANMKETFLPSEIEIPVLQSTVTVQVDGAEYDEDTEFPPGLPLPTVKPLTISSPSEKVTIRFIQHSTPNACLKGELEIAKDDLQGGKYLRLAIDSDLQITVQGPQDSSLNHFVEMFAV